MDPNQNPANPQNPVDGQYRDLNVYSQDTQQYQQTTSPQQSVQPQPVAYDAQQYQQTAQPAQEQYQQPTAQQAQPTPYMQQQAYQQYDYQQQQQPAVPGQQTMNYQTAQAKSSLMDKLRSQQQKVFFGAIAMLILVILIAIIATVSGGGSSSAAQKTDEFVELLENRQTEAALDEALITIGVPKNTTDPSEQVQIQNLQIQLNEVSEALQTSGSEKLSEQSAEVNSLGLAEIYTAVYGFSDAGVNYEYTVSAAFNEANEQWDLFSLLLEEV